MKSEPNKEDVSLEEITLQGIISSCENMLDDLEEGANISDEDMKYLIYTDNMIMEIQQRIGENFSPSNIQGGFYPSDGGFAPMTDRVYFDDEHGNTL